MTMIRPAVGVVSRMIDSVSLKTALAAILSVTAWHFTDAGKIEANRQQSIEQGKRLDFQREALTQKIDREQYLADQKELHDDLRELHLDFTQLIIMERKGQ